MDNINTMPEEHGSVLVHDGIFHSLDGTLPIEELVSKSEAFITFTDQELTLVKGYILSRTPDLYGIANNTSSVDLKRPNRNSMIVTFAGMRDENNYVGFILSPHSMPTIFEGFFHNESLLGIERSIRVSGSNPGVAYQWGFVGNGSRYTGEIRMIKYDDTRPFPLHDLLTNIIFKKHNGSEEQKLFAKEIQDTLRV